MTDTKRTIRIKDKGKHIVLYAEETKSKEFDTENDANEFAEQVEKDFD